MIASLNWAWVPVALLGSLSTGLALMISIAVNDPGFAVEPGYHQHALNWDVHRAQLARSSALGWSSTWELDKPNPSGLGWASRAHLVVNLKDAVGSPLEHAAVSVSGFANARAAEVHTRALLASAPGVYTAEVAITRPGIWHFELVATRAGDRYTEQVTIEFGADGRVLSLGVVQPSTPTTAREGQAR